jgi:predicted protein tyrosine phosphatase
MKRVLFICGKGHHGSPTAAQTFSSHHGWQSDSAARGANADVGEVVCAENIARCDEYRAVSAGEG